MIRDLKVAVVIPSVGRPDGLASCLDALARQTARPSEVVVVGQGEDWATRQICVAARERCPNINWRYVHSPQINMVKALNRGVAVISAEVKVVAFTDDDARPAADWVERLGAWFEDPKVGAVGGPNIDHKNGKAIVRFAQSVGKVTWFGRYVGNHDALTPSPQDVYFLRGCNMAFRKELLTPFPEALGPYWAANEILPCAAVRRRGFRVVFDPSLRVSHFPEERPRVDKTLFPNYEDWLATVVENSAFNFVFALSAALSPGRRLAFWAYEFLVGTRRTPGIGRRIWAWVRAEKDAAMLPLWVSLRGKVRGLYGYLRARSELARLYGYDS